MRASSGFVPPHDWEQYRALFDSDTGLPGWALLVDRTRLALARAGRLHRIVAVLAIEGVEEFPTGELKAVAARFPSLVRPDDTVARVGPGLFVIACNDTKTDGDAARIAERLVRDVAPPLRLGIALSRGTEDAVDVIARAMQQAGAEPTTRTG